MTLDKIVVEDKNMVKNETNELLKQILGVLNEIKDATLKPITSQLVPPPATLGASPIPVEKPKPILQPPSPVQRDIVNRILSKEFEVEIEPMNGSAYKFTIVVPDKYSAIPPVQRGPKIRDLRPKVLHYSDGDMGVEQWSTLVYKSFPPDTQAIMAMER